MSAAVLQFPTMAKREDLPNRVREWRARRDLKLKDLAPKVGVSVSHMSKIEGLRKAAAFLRERRLIDTYREIPAPMRAAMDAVAESQQPFRGFGEIEDLAQRKAG